MAFQNNAPFNKVVTGIHSHNSKENACKYMLKIVFTYLISNLSASNFRLIKLCERDKSHK